MKPTSNSLWTGTLVACVSAGISFVLYWTLAAPDLTWQHQGADGGDLLSAAVSGGVPHPTGYPLYTLLLRAWLLVGKVLVPTATPARLGNLLSATLAAASVGCTVFVVGVLIDGGRAKWWLAMAIGLLWSVSPLLWGQALITEVYTLHVLLVVVVVWAILRGPTNLALIGVLIGLGIANHVTYLLVLPALAFILVYTRKQDLYTWRSVSAIVIAIAVAGVLYLRIPFAAGRHAVVPPVNWGYADNWRGFWWLVSGEAYRSYLNDNSWRELGIRFVNSTRIMVTQYTPLGVLIAAAGLAYWNRSRPHWHTFALILLVPVSVYAVVYATVDSQVYLLPAAWLMAVMIGVGTVAIVEWAANRFGMGRERALWVGGALVLTGVLALAVVRGPQLSLRHDDDALRYLHTVAEVVEPGSIVVSSSDRYTFALWYSAWASGDLLQQAPGLVLVNDALYQFDWYRRLLGDVYPHVAGIDESFAELLAQNAGMRPIYFAEYLDSVPAENQEPIGGIWRYVP
jgi:hypothetical protein